MPVYLDRVPSSNLLKTEKVHYGHSSREVLPMDLPSVDIGIVNNMPDGAIKATERQFLDLLDSAADGLAVNLTFYALSDVPRSERAWRHINSFYAKIENLWDRHLDGLIVTGAEPRTSNLSAEPYWPILTGLVDWAQHNTHSSIWSCLAAHAAVLHLDGVTRRPLVDKRFGLFRCDQLTDHVLTDGLPSRLIMPHSRWNDLAADDLANCGYEVLTGSADAGVDTFVKLKNSLFVFFQGHPEYEANTLLLEYRRDIGRYLRGERETYPSMPANCFDPGIANTLRTLQDLATRDRREELLADFPVAQVEGTLKSTWSSLAARIYRNWLTYLYAAKTSKPLPAKHPVPVRRLAAGAD